MARPLYKKLGIPEEGNCCVVQSPGNYRRLTECPFEPELYPPEAEVSFDFIHLFASRLEDLEKFWPALKSRLAKDGAFWISWPKKSSGRETDLDSNAVRSYGLDNGLVDVKVASVNDTWSALKFVFRLKDR